MKKLILFVAILLLTTISFAQTVVKGRVVDAQGESIPGVSVLEQGTTNGVTTNIDGTFSLTVKKDAKLIFSFVGMKELVVSVDGRNWLDVTLEESVAALDEIVVVGYGVQRKSDVTGSIASVKSEELEKISGASAVQALQGQVAGVQITSATGSPGSAATVLIRGRGTVGDSSPLYVIDGLAVGDISFLNTKDIQSIEVLKDASATAIYGARGANGVVLITTKQGKAGEMQVTYDGYYGVQSVWNEPDLLDAQEWIDVQNQARANAGEANLDLKPGADNPNHTTDWFDEITRNAIVQDHNIRISGGGENLKATLSGNLYDQEGLIEGSDYTRYSLRINSEAKLSNYVTVGENLSITQSKRHSILEGNYFNGIVNAALKLDPITPVKNADDEYMSSPYTDVMNPVAHIENTNDERKYQRLVGNIYADVKLLPNLVYHSSYGMDINDVDFYDFNPTYFYAIDEKNEVNSVTRSHTKTTLWNWINTLTYMFEVDKHSFTLMGGMEATESDTEWFSASKNNVPSNEDYLRFLSAALGDENGMGTASGSLSEWSMLSYFGRLNYNYDNKYYLTANLRHDGSSKFGKDKRWGTFPSVALKWKISNETFFQPMAENGTWTSAALRAGWGQVGNDKISLYQYTTAVSNNKQYGYVFGKDQRLYYGATIEGIGNPSIHWETVESTNIGLDLAFLNNRLGVTFDWFNKKTKEMLLREPIPDFVGYTSSPYSNVGDVENRGWELSLNYKGSPTDDLSYNLGINLGRAKTEVLDLGEVDFLSAGFVRIDNATRTEVGNEIGAFYGYVTDGIFQTQAEIDSHATQSGAQPGDIRFKDLNDDGKIDAEDRTFIGSPYPDLTYGFNLGINYKDFDFSMFWQGVYGNDLFNFMIFETMNPGKTTNKYTDILDSWNGPGTSNSVPRLSTQDTNDNLRVSDRYIEDGSYLRLRNIQLGYSLPVEVTDKLRVNRVRLYVAAQNLFTITDYSGLDPEIGRYDSLSIGIDEGIFPHARTWMIGANITF
ncbi:TonB-linked SusC/RagA family outer membrane protein [Balneicella halophila]|uniref:TonB-linked SusC/RagA family outer membrane protein n=1 Tax=Balneicella halophila TaxID=1537566 RepID=A0A7L4UTA8_BALHA|nr:TonB-dependent receptor [Balneicella halophila]PVX52324.1 TonB-linked SusC/RagA family outer membrane protein [Balneicella halophila]